VPSLLARQQLLQASSIQGGVSDCRKATGAPCLSAPAAISSNSAPAAAGTLVINLTELGGERGGSNTVTASNQQQPAGHSRLSSRADLAFVLPAHCWPHEAHQGAEAPSPG